MEYKKLIDQSDYIESAAIMDDEDLVYAGNCRAPCKSCGGGCYGCKGSRGAEISYENKSLDLAEIVDQF
jgi:hypothetical protein